MNQGQDKLVLSWKGLSRAGDYRSRNRNSAAMENYRGPRETHSSCRCV